MYKAVMIGTGGIAECHINVCRKFADRMKLYGMADICPEKAESLKQKFELDCSVYTDYIQMLEQLKPDFAIVNLPHDLHLQALEACAKRKCNVLMEKPMALDPAQCESMTAISEQNGIKLTIGHVMEFVAQTEAARKIVDSGKLGRLLSVVDYRTSEYFTEDRPGWFLDVNKAGGGIIMNLGAHSIDRISFITGRRVRHVCKASLAFDPYYKGIEGSAVICMELEGAVPCSLICHGYGGEKNLTELYFSGGILEVRHFDSVWVRRNGGRREAVDVLPQDPFEKQLEAFLDYMEGRIENPVPPEYGSYVIETIYKIYDISRNVRPMQPRIAFCTVADEQGSLEELLPQITLAGYEGVEIWEPYISKFFSEGKRIADLKKLLQDYNLAVPVISTYFSFMEGEEKYRESLEHGRKVSEIARKLGCPYIRVLMDWIGSQEATASQWETGIRALKELAEIGKIYDVGLVLETHQNQLFDTTEMTLNVLREAGKDNIKINLDIFNLYWVGENPVESLESLFPYIAHIHLKNGALIENKLKCGFYLNNGSMDYEPFFEKLRSMKYSGWLSVEWFGEDIRSAARHEYEFIKKMTTEEES